VVDRGQTRAHVGLRMIVGKNMKKGGDGSGLESDTASKCHVSATLLRK
jgi:hypothetical protein